jgi:hypothetical protein
MKLRVLMMVALVFAISACNTPKTKKDTRMPPRKDMADQSADTSFQAFLGRLNKAVAAHDLQMMASMMTPDFGYRLEPPGEGAGVFQYWDHTNSWPALRSVLAKRFVPKNNYMVAPPQFATDPQYAGFRAGIRQYNGSWRFAYFVKD